MSPRRQHEPAPSEQQSVTCLLALSAVSPQLISRVPHLLRNKKNLGLSSQRLSQPSVLLISRFPLLPAPAAFLRGQPLVDLERGALVRYIFFFSTLTRNDDVKIQ